MTVARLTASLLAAKGKAFPIANAYASPFLDPLPTRRDRSQQRKTSTACDPRCRIGATLHARLRILAARQGRPLRIALEAAVTDYLAANGNNCPCVGSGNDQRTGSDTGACCHGRG